MENETLKTKLKFISQKQKIMLIRVQNVALEARCLWLSRIDFRPLCLRNDYVEDCER